MGNATEPKVGMTFNVPEEWHSKFKATAALNSMDMHELLYDAFDAWLEMQSVKEHLANIRSCKTIR